MCGDEDGRIMSRFDSRIDQAALERLLEVLGKHSEKMMRHFRAVHNGAELPENEIPYIRLDALVDNEGAMDGVMMNYSSAGMWVRKQYLFRVYSTEEATLRAIERDVIRLAETCEFLFNGN